MATTAIEHKALTFSAIEIKDAQQGEVEACVATLGVVDNDGDYMRPGCIEDGSKVMMSDYGHSIITDGQRPVGKGVISIRGTKAMFRGKLFMDTMAGQETFKTLKAMGPDQEWSFGYQVVTASVPSDEEKAKGAYRSLDKLKSFEVSPVFMGAGKGTGTTSIKSDKAQADGFSELESRVATLEAKIAKREDVNPDEGSSQYGDVAFADPVNKKYPIDTEEHIRAAWNYINHPNAADKYSADDLRTIKDRIVRAWKEKIDKEGPPSATEKSAEQIALERKEGERIAQGAAAEFERFMRTRRQTP